MGQKLRTLVRTSLLWYGLFSFTLIAVSGFIWFAHQENARLVRLGEVLSDVVSSHQLQDKRMGDNILMALPATSGGHDAAASLMLARALARPVIGHDLVVVQDAAGQALAWFDARGERHVLGYFGEDEMPSRLSREQLYLPEDTAGAYWRFVDGSPALVSVSALVRSAATEMHRVVVYSTDVMDKLRQACVEAGMVCAWRRALDADEISAAAHASLLPAMQDGVMPVSLRTLAGLTAVWRLSTPAGEAPLFFEARSNAFALWQNELLLCLAVGITLALLFLVCAGFAERLAERGVNHPFQRLRRVVGAIHAEHRGVDTGLAGLVREAPPSLASDLDGMRYELGELAAGQSRRLAGIKAWANAVADSHEAMFIMDAQGSLVRVNDAYLVQAGLDEMSAIGHTAGFIAAGLYDDNWLAAMWKSLHEKGCWAGEVRDVRGDGRTQCYWLSLSEVTPSTGEDVSYLGIMSDFSHRKEQEDRLQYLAQHDALTGLPNRETLMDRIRVAIAQAQREGHLVAALYIDLDRFKQINDTLGHAVGDALLINVAERLKRAVRAADTVARLGADEYVILLHKLRNKEDAARVAEHILATMGPTARVEGHELSITPSIGVAVFPDDAIDADELMRNADVAMYHAKSEGRNNYQMFQREMSESAEESLSLEHALRRATDRDEFQLYYQPQIDIGTRRLVGVEALIRWNSVEFGMVPPSKFVRLAEECGLIPHIGNWILREACRQRAEWDADGLEQFPIAVNVSALQFRQVDFVRRVEEALRLYGISPSMLELELTERIVMHESETTAAALTRLREMGVTLSVDDFGTGYSSLAYLKRLPVQRLKIDGVFVRGIEKDAADRAIVEAIISLGRALKLSLVAEGVEERSTVTLLGRMGCTVAQGYYYCRPQPPRDFLAWYREYYPERAAAPAPTVAAL